MQRKRVFYGLIPSTGEKVTILDYREVIDTTTNHNLYTTSSALGAEPHCRTEDGRSVRVKNGDFKYVDYENLEGEWEIRDTNITGNWIPLTVSRTPPQ